MVLQRPIAIAGSRLKAWRLHLSGLRSIWSETQNVESNVSEKREKFLSMSEKRKEKAVKAIAAIGNLSTPAYEWERAEVEQLLADLQAELDNTRGRFERTRRWKA